MAEGKTEAVNQVPINVCEIVFLLQKKQAEDKVTKKQLCKQSELDRLKKEEMRDRQQQSEAAFSAWKRHKDVEWEMERQFIKHQHRSITPPIRGACT